MKTTGFVAEPAILVEKECPANGVVGEELGFSRGATDGHQPGDGEGGQESERPAHGDIHGFVLRSFTRYPAKNPATP